MQTVAVHVHRRDDRLDLEADLRRARWLANLLDARFSIAGIRFGLDAIIGLIPGFGDIAALLGALYPLYLVHKHSLPRRYVNRMILNIAIDFIGGTIPLVGDLFDVYYKANLRNLALLEKTACG